MYLDAVRDGSELVEVPGLSRGIDHTPVFDAWRDWSPSMIRHHGRICCEIAREWLTATDFSALSGGHVLMGPRWLRHRFPWGPSSYPLYWCQAVRSESLDCGALAALAHEVFTIRGVKSFRVQMVLRYSRVATAQWNSTWTGDGVPTLWLNDDTIYHEGCAVLTGPREIKVWDASAGAWMEPKAGDGYGALLAIKITCSPRMAALAWGGYMIEPNRWRAID